VISTSACHSDPVWMCSELANAGNTVPVLILTSRDTWREKVDGFNAGADDMSLC
jgi:DNA-binding response OmpR family regulator